MVLIIERDISRSVAHVCRQYEADYARRGTQFCQGSFVAGTKVKKILVLCSGTRNSTSGLIPVVGIELSSIA
jgi:hypothetical protein